MCKDSGTIPVLCTNFHHFFLLEIRSTNVPVVNSSSINKFNIGTGIKPYQYGAQKESSFIYIFGCEKTEIIW